MATRALTPYDRCPICVQKRRARQRRLGRRYARRNESFAVDIEQDAILLGLTALVVGVVGYLIYQKVTSTGAVVLANAQEALNQAIGGQPVLENEAPLNSQEPEDQVGYE